MNLKPLVGMTGALLVLLSTSCSERSSIILSPSSGAGSRLAGGSSGGSDGSGPSGPQVASGHFAMQDVDVIERDGTVSAGSFRGDFKLFANGRARGSALLFVNGRMVVYRFTEGRLACREGEVIVVMDGLTGEVGSSGPTDIFSATLMRVDDDHPECIIWDIKDSCSHEATGKFDVENICPR